MHGHFGVAPDVFGLKLCQSYPGTGEILLDEQLFALVTPTACNLLT